MGSKKYNQNQQHLVLDKIRSGDSRPPMYAVYLLNDDYTPMDFVVEVLEKFFFMNNAQAIHLMLQVHHLGHAICGVFSKDVAEMKVRQVQEYAKQHQHPLMCGMKKN